MLEWLKTILGDGYNDDLDKKIAAEIGKNFVAKSDFNTTNEAKKTLEATLAQRDGELDTLRKASGDAATLQQQILDLQKANADLVKTHAEEIKRLKLDNAVEAALVGAKAKNVKAVKALLELDKAEMAEDGTVKGLEEQIKALIDSPETGFLFETEQKKPGSFKGILPNDGERRQ